MVSMVKKCKHCLTNNPAEAKYCRYCGVSFEYIPISSKEKEIVDSLTRKWKVYSQWKRPITGFIIRCIITTLITLILASLTYLVLLYLDVKTNIQMISTIAVALVLFTIGIYINRKQLPTTSEKNDFYSIYDKVEPYHYTGIRHSRKKRFYKLFVKSGKMGVLDVTNYRVLIKANYSSIQWKVKQYIITVTINNDTFDITL